MRQLLLKKVIFTNDNIDVFDNFFTVLMSNPGSYFIEKLRKGDVRAFEQVFNTHYASLCRYAQKFVIDLDNAREIVQDTFVKFWEIKHSLSQDTSVKSYLYKAVRNNCLDYLKHIKISNDYKEDLLRKVMDSGFKSIASPENCLDGLIEKELEDRINDAIASLPDRCREMFELSRFKGLKYHEIAEELNISIKTVETQISRAIHSLHKKLANYFE